MGENNMREPEMWEIPALEITLDEVFQAEGADYTQRPPHRRTVELHHQIMEEAATLVRPTAIWVEVDVTGTGVGELFLEDGYKPVSYTHLRAHETRHDLVCRLLLEKK